MRINYFTVVSRSYKLNGGQYMFLCKCDCGSEFLVSGCNLLHRKSCGCKTEEINRNHATKHGGRYERLYKVWVGIKYRCNNPNSPEYDIYGGRGIKVCEEWERNYAAFRKWALENGYDATAKRNECTIDRIDNDGDYKPDNCRWTDERTQSNNRRSSKYLTIDGERKTVTEWSRVSGVGPKTILYRLRNGWEVKDAVYMVPDRGSKYIKREKI